MKALPVRLFHASLFGMSLGVAAVVGYFHLTQNARAEWGGVGGLSNPPAAILNPVSTDTDGDGMPNTWEAANLLSGSLSSDALSDFDKDGLTAIQEYQLNLATSGQYGKHLGKWTASAIPRPTGFTTATPSVTLIECASNGVILARVQGVLIGETYSKSFPYTYSPATGTWTRIAAPAGFPSVTSLTPLDVNCYGQVVGYFNSSGTKGFLWTPDASGGGQTTVFQLNTSSGMVHVVPKRISDFGYIVGNVGSLGGRSVVGAINSSGNGDEISFATCSFVDTEMGMPVSIPNLWNNPTFQDVNDYGEIIGTVYNPMTSRVETFLAVLDGGGLNAGYVFLTGIEPSDLLQGATGAWAHVPDIDPDEIAWIDTPYGGHRGGTVIDRSTGQTVIVHEGYGAEFYWFYDTGYYDSTWYSYPGFSPVFGAVNDWGEFAGTYSAWLSPTNFSFYTYDGYEYANQTSSSSSSLSESGLFFYCGSYHGSKSRPSIYGVSNDSRVLIGTPYAIWSGSLVVPIANLMPAGNPTTFNFARLADRGRMFLQQSSSTQIYILQPNQDTDGDGMPDDWEKFYLLDPNNAADASEDSDEDGICNLVEFQLRTDPKNPPGAPPSVDLRPGIDTDGDGMPNVWEWKYGLNYNDASDANGDLDGDGLSNLQEFLLATIPNDPDTDNDGVSDGKEALTNGTNPLVYRDLDNDDMPDDWELDFCQRLIAHRDILTPEQIAILETNNLDPQTDILDEGAPNLQRSQEERNTPITSFSADRVFQTKARHIVLGRIYPFNPEFPDAISYVWMQYDEGSDIIASSNKDWASATQTFGELETKLPWSGCPWWTTTSGDGVYGSGWPLLSGMRNHDQGGGYGFSHSESMIRIKAHDISEKNRDFSYFERVQSINRNSPEQEPTENVVRTHTFTVPAGKTLSQEIKVDSAALQNGVDSTTHLFPVEVEQESYTSEKGIRFCRWLDSFKENTLNSDCADKDRDRFRIRISGVVPNLTKIHIKSFWLATAVINGGWESKSTDGDYDVTMTEENGAMVSKWMLLVSDGDDDVDYNGIGTDNGPNDQTLLADFNSPIEVTLPEYQNAKVTFRAQKPLGDLEIQPYYLSPAGNVPPPMESIIMNHLEKMKEIYRQIGVRVGYYGIEGKAVPQSWFDAGENYPDEPANHLTKSETVDARILLSQTAVPEKQIRVGFVDATLMVGYGPGIPVLGVAPMGSDPAIISLDRDRSDARWILAVTAHEVGHALGLDHLEQVEPAQYHPIPQRWLMRDGGDRLSIWENKPTDTKRFQSGDFDIIRNSNFFYAPN